MFVIGLAKKVLLANQLVLLWETVAADPHAAGTLAAWFGMAAYTLHIYFDFGGYSNMARGLGAMMGFDFCINFDYPYCANSITDFWRRWHISLSTWFRDYVYIPLGGSRKGTGNTARNLLIGRCGLGILCLSESCLRRTISAGISEWDRRHGPHAVAGLAAHRIGWHLCQHSDSREILEQAPGQGHYASAGGRTLSDSTGALHGWAGQRQL